MAAEVIAECRQAARVAPLDHKRNWAATAVILGIWLLLFILTARFI